MNTEVTSLRTNIDNLLERLDKEEKKFKMQIVKRLIIYASLIISLIIVPAVLAVGAYLVIFPIDK